MIRSEGFRDNSLEEGAFLERIILKLFKVRDVNLNLFSDLLTDGCLSEGIIKTHLKTM